MAGTFCCPSVSLMHYFFTFSLSTTISSFYWYCFIPQLLQLLPFTLLSALFASTGLYPMSLSYYCPSLQLLCFFVHCIPNSPTFPSPQSMLPVFYLFFLWLFLLRRFQYLWYLSFFITCLYVCSNLLLLLLYLLLILNLIIVVLLINFLY